MLAAGCPRSATGTHARSLRVVRADVWNDQVQDVVEFYAAWVPCSRDYRADRARAMRLLAGRKRCGDFKQPKFADAGLPKSSLDGQRPTVLAGPRAGEPHESYRDRWPKELRRKLRLSPGEQLDAVGLVKRLGKRRGESDPHYPSLARVAAEPWLRRIEKEGRLQPLKEACEKLRVKGLRIVGEGNYRYFPYEGTVLYKDRHADLSRELGLEAHDLDAVAAALAELGGGPSLSLAGACRRRRRDGRGAFAIEVRARTPCLLASARRFRGQRGKDRRRPQRRADLCGRGRPAGAAARRPLPGLRRRLHDLFADLPSEHGALSLSVGVAIGQFTDDLQDLLEHGRAAARAAKGVDGKDALAVHLQKRGGAAVRVRDRWASDLDRRLLELASLMGDKAGGKGDSPIFAANWDSPRRKKIGLSRGGGKGDSPRQFPP